MMHALQINGRAPTALPRNCLPCGLPDCEPRSSCNPSQVAKPPRLKNELQAPQELPGIERRGEAERFTLPEITIPLPGQPYGASTVIRRRERRGEGENPSPTDRDRVDLVDGGKVRAIEQIRGVGREVDPRG